MGSWQLQQLPVATLSDDWSEVDRKLTYVIESRLSSVISGWEAKHGELERAREELARKIRRECHVVECDLQAVETVFERGDSHEERDLNAGRGHAFVTWMDDLATAEAVTFKSSALQRATTALSKP